MLSLTKMMDYCTYCPKMCQFSCPASDVEKNETYTPWGKMQIAHYLENREVSLTGEMALASFKCLDCLRCQQYCEHKVDVPESLRVVRKKAVSNYAAPSEVYRFEEKFHKHNNPYGRNLTGEIKKLLPDECFENLKSRVFWPSCHTLQFYPQKILAVLELFEKLGVGEVSVYLPDIQCCGYPLEALGFARDFEELAEVQYYTLRDSEFIITDGAQCTQNLIFRYKEKHFPLDKKVMHILNFIEPYLEKANYKTKDFNVDCYTYYDPFFLSRHLELSELPRSLLEGIIGLAPSELGAYGKDVIACGLGGGYEYLFPQSSKKMAMKMMEELKEKKIKHVFTACSQTQAHLSESFSGIEVFDLLEFLNKHISQGSRQK